MNSSGFFRFLPLTGIFLFLQICCCFTQLPQNATLGTASADADFGPWGPWTESSDCSRTCSGGVAFQDRICMDTRADGRHSCVGAARKYTSCNIEDCPIGSKDYRSVQCARFNTLPYEGKFYSWEPYYKAQNPCELNCMPKGQRFYTRMARKVIDGTRCKDDGSMDLCIDGFCTPVGCDRVLGSALREDACRVCGGDGTSCRVVGGVVDRDDFDVGYNDILLIPVGATSILIQEVQPTNNYLAVRSASGEFHLNGQWRIQQPRELRFAGALFRYERRPAGPESLRADGPTDAPLFVVLLYQEKNLGVRYEYSIPAAAGTAEPDTYAWTFGDFEECSRTCGGGVQHRPVHCVRTSDRDQVDDGLCDPLRKPDASATCNAQPCDADWQIGEWSECSSPCGGGAQFRLVFCARKEEGGAAALAPDDTCPTTKPLFMRACNEDNDCPGWTAQEWSECDASCGAGNRTRVVECRGDDGEESASCPASERPAESEPCSPGPCEGVEWIVSEWSGCDGSCSPRMESRSAHCATEDGAVFPDSACEPARAPQLARPCAPSALCEPMWHTSQWSDCSVSCGGGVQSRVVFCGVWENESVIKIEDEKCTPDKRFPDVQNCSASPCHGVWFTGPWTTCSAPCSGGTRQRKILCFFEEEVAEAERCDAAEQPFDSEACNEKPCDEDEMMLLPPGCKDAPHGCCPDGLSSAGPNYEGCPTAKATENRTCEEAEYGCCADGDTLALGPFRKGCSGTQACNSTKHGCCPDDVTPAKGPDYQGCPEETNCTDSEFGCCPDNFTAAQGNDFEGCSEDCINSTHGCCPDGVTSAEGPDMEGCLREEVNCTNTTFGCCPDNVTTALGESMEGCDSNCTNTTHGCCPDGRTLATGEDFEGCEDLESSGEDCYTTKFGCCPDKLTKSTGPGQEGCDEVENSTDCSTSAFGCCEDGMVAAEGPFKAGCFGEEGSGDEELSLSCNETIFGCCPDNVTTAKEFDMSGCPTDCNNTTHGCCPDNVTVALGPDGDGCDCHNATFGCCPDNVTTALGFDGEGCPEVECANSTFGCCPDNATLASGPENAGCYPEDCSNSTHGCCPDNLTSALGPDREGCPPGDCFNSSFGCCPDNVTQAEGPDWEGCDCSNSTFGCCPDNVTKAAGDSHEGCDLEPVDCINSTFGCCQDNVSLATGPDEEGCGNATNCTSSEFGCCPDEVTPAAGLEFEGCLDTALTTALPITTTKALAECANTVYGCCPDEETVALGPHLQGCCFGMRFGCCPDNVTAALGPTFLGCGCQTYPYGCCPDNITPAQGFKYLGCRCEHFRYGCCQDKLTAATGPHFEGCLCQLMRYGCCPDGVTPIVGPEGEGCGCDSAPHGCCPDGKTAATSADPSGCPCDTLPYGCCPDGRTPARSADPHGCPCHTYRFGCCPDGRTVARGPSLEGCPCQSTRFGCCPDGRTPAQGPDAAGCSCETTPYGCCADGFSAAKGSGGEGCPEVRTPAPTRRSDVCRLPKDKGSCSNYTVKWFFDVPYGSCMRFWFGGCDSNGNVFATQEECEQVCVRPQGPESCLLPKVSGPCEGKYESWYYDSGSRDCEPFTYSGCLGNSNRFASRELCQAQCLSLRPDAGPVDVCSLPKEEGPCDNTLIQWYFKGENNRCEQFYYGGCEGNGNRFGSRADCEQACLTRATPEPDVCRLPQKAGSCADFRERWFHDPASGQCRRFYYGGCDGNLNNFASRHDCESRCLGGVPPTAAPPREEAFKTEFCLLLQDAGPCSGAEPRWHYDSRDGVCKEFRYGGCEGNRNRFETRAECETSCVQPQDVCSLPAARGPCSGSFPQWHYDGQRDDCFEFQFSGCQGNANRFDDRDACYRKCKKVLPPAPATELPPPAPDVCSLPQESGPCNAYYLMWFFDARDGVCKTFAYGGCDGNANRFEQRADCEQRCTKKIPREPSGTVPDVTRSSNEDVCRLPVESGPCAESQPRWFYDSRSQSCLPFVFGGCGGNKNRFKSSEMCLRFCTGIAAVSLDQKSVYRAADLATSSEQSPALCPPSNCGEIQCPFGIEESFTADGCSTCRCSNPCEVHSCPAGSRCAIEVTRTSAEGTRTEPVCRRVEKPGECSAPEVVALTSRDCERRCRDDADCRGDHKCCTNGCAFVCAAPAAEVDDFESEKDPVPASILPGPNMTEAQVGEAARLPCHAVGRPRPTVTWWREATMLPLSSRRYEQGPDFALLIRSVVSEDRGDYSCFAFNGLGAGATHRITLIIDLGGAGHESREAEPQLPPETPADDLVTLTASASLATLDPVEGSSLQIDCAAEGPELGARLSWRLDDAPLTADDRRRILANHTLYVTRAEAADAGEYRCTVELGERAVSSAVTVRVRAKPTDSSCVDNPQFSNCEIIVHAKYCNNKYYGRFCCASCLRAGQLTNWPVE